MIKLRWITVLTFIVAVLAIGSVGSPQEPIIIGSVEPSSPPGSIAQGVRPLQESNWLLR